MKKAGFIKTAAFTVMIAAALLVSFVVSGKAASGFTETQTKDIQAIIHDYLVENPEVVIKALDAYQANQKEIEAKLFQERITKYRDQLLGEKQAVAGNPKGDVTIVEFFDYNCGYCKKAVDDVVKILEKDKNVRIVFKDMPILSPSSQEAARWALAAGLQGKYYEYHIALMNKNGAKNTSTFEQVGKEVGLDVEQLRKDAETNKDIRRQIEENMTIARELGIRGTPAFIIGDYLSPGYIGYEAMNDAVEKARN